MGTGSYDWITFAQAKQALAVRLDDSQNVHWSDTELGLYINEALTVWQALTGYWRDRGTFNLTASQIFYDLPTLLKDSGGNLMLQMAVTDSDVLPLIQYHLLEPPTIPWTGSTQFTLGEITSDLQDNRDNFLAETGAVVTHSIVNVPPAPIGRFQLDDHVIDVRRVAWLPTNPGTNLKHLPLWMSDEFAANASLPGWNLNPETPESYSIIGPRPLEVQLIPVPLDKGQCDLLTVRSGAALDPSIGIPLGIPTNYVWVVKWGALACLLSQDGEPRDEFRAGYCRQRYEEGCELARMMPVILTSALNEVQVFPQAIADLDGYRPDWAGTDGVPDSVACVGQNMVAIGPPPDNAMVYSFRADVVKNAVVPVTDGDFLQIGREYIDSLLNESQHLALFKSGGREFADTIPLHQDFIQSAANYNDRLKAMQIYLNTIAEQSNAETKARPRMESDVTEVTR
jgi:hypothetical protein